MNNNKASSIILMLTALSIFIDILVRFQPSYLVYSLCRIVHGEYYLCAELNNVCLTNERHHPRRRSRHPPPPNNHCSIQAAAAHLRQTDGILPSFYSPPCRHPRHPHHINPGRHRLLSSPPR